MVIDDDIPLLRTFRSELAKRSSVLMDEDMQGFFEELSEYEGYTGTPGQFYGITPSQFTAKATATVTFQKPETSELVSKAYVRTETVPDRPVQKPLEQKPLEVKVKSRTISSVPEQKNRLSLKLESMTGVRAPQPNQEMGWKPPKVSQTLVTVKEENVAPISQFLHKPGVLNTKTNMKMTLSEAIKTGLFDPRTKCLTDPKNHRELSYEEACQSGLISRELKQELGKSSGILNVLTGRPFTVLESMQKGVFDPVHGTVRDHSTGKHIPVHQAATINIITEDIAESLIGPEVSVTTITQSQAIFGEGCLDSIDVPLSLAEMVEKGFYDPQSGKLRDPISGAQLTIIDAVEKGYVNPSKKEIKDPESKEFVTIVEAVGKSLLDPETGLFNDKSSMEKLKLDEAYEHQILNRPLTLPKMVRDGILSDRGHVTNPRTGEVMSFSDALDSGLIDDSVKCVVNPRTNDVLSLSEAIEQGFLDSRGLFVPPGASPAISISEALVQGHLKLVQEEVIFPKPCVLDAMTGNKIPASDALRHGVITHSGEFVDTATNRKILLGAAGSQGLVDKDVVEKLTKETTLRDATSKNISFMRAIQIGMIDVGKGQICDFKTGDVMNLQEAVKEGLISSEDAETLMEMLSSAVTHTTVITKVQPSSEESSIEPMTMLEAKQQGLINEYTGNFRNPITGATMSIDEALQKGYLIPDEEETQYYVEEMDDQEPLEELDEEGRWLREVSQKHAQLIPGTSATESKLIRKGDSGFSFTTTTVSRPPVQQNVVSETRHIAVQSALDPRTKERISPQEAVKRGLLDMHQGCFIHPATGKKLTIVEAISQGFLTGKDVDEVDSHEGSAISEVKSFSITGVIHPSTKQRITISQATKGGILHCEKGLYIGRDAFGREKPMKISDAVNAGFILADTVSHDAPSAAELIRETKQFTIKSVVHPHTRKHVPVIEAVREGIIDEHNGIYHDFRTGEKLTIIDAIERKLIEAELTSVTSSADGSGNKIITTKLTTLMVSWVVDPRTGETISISKAIEEGIIDQQHGSYHNLVTGETMSINDAIERKLAIAKSSTQESSESSSIHSIHITDEQESFEATLVEDIHSETVTFSISSVIDPQTMEMISYDDAVESNILDIANGVYRNPASGEEIPINEALNKGLIHADITGKKREEDLMRSAFVAEKIDFPLKNVTTVKDPKTGMEMSAMRAIQFGLVDLEDGMFLDTRTSKRIPLKSALRQGFITLSKTTDPAEIERLQNESSDSIQPPKFSENGLSPSVVDMKLEKSGTRESKTSVSTCADEVLNYTTDIEQSMDASFNDDSTDGRIVFDFADKLQMERGAQGIGIESLTFPKGFSYTEAVKIGLVDPTSGKVRDPSSQKLISLQEAMMAGIINPKKPALVTKTGDHQLTLQDCMREGYIDPKTGKLNFGKCSEEEIVVSPNFTSQFSKPGPLNLLDAVRANLFDEITCTFLEPLSGNRLTLQEALNRNVIDGNLVTVENTETGRRLSLKMALRQEWIDGFSANVKDFASKSTISLIEAVDRGLIANAIDEMSGTLYDTISGKEIPLAKALTSGQVKKDDVMVLDKRTGDLVSLDTAMRKGLVQRNSGIVTDTKTGEKIKPQDAIKMGLLAVVGAPVLGGMALYDAVTRNRSEPEAVSTPKSTIEKSRKLSEKKDQPKIDKPNTNGHSDSQTNGRFEKFTQELEESAPKTTVVFAKPGDNIQPSQPSWTPEKKEDDSFNRSNLVSEEQMTEDAQEIFKRMREKDTKSGVKLPTNPIPASSKSPAFRFSPSATEQVKVSAFPPSASISETILQEAPSPSPSPPPTILSSLTIKDNITVDWPAGKVIVKDSGEVVNVAEAVQKGYLDSETVEKLAEAALIESKSPDIEINWNDGTVTVKETRETVSIDEALKRKYIDVHIHETLRTVIEKIEEIKKTSTVTPQETVTRVKRSCVTSHAEQPQVQPQVSTVKTERQQFLKTTMSEVHVPQDNRWQEQTTTKESAYIVHHQPPSFNQDAQKTTTKEMAYVVHHHPSPTLSHSQEAFESFRHENFSEGPWSLNELVQDDRCTTFDGKIYVPHYGIPITIQECINRHFLNIDTSCIIDPRTGVVINLWEAMKKNIIDAETGIIVHTGTGERITLKEAVYEGLIPQPGYSYTSFSEEVVGLTSGSLHMSWKDAVDQGLLNQKMNTFQHPYSKEVMSVSSAVELGHIYHPGTDNVTIETTEVQLKPMKLSTISMGNNISFTDAIQYGMLDLESNQYTETDTGTQMTIQEAIKTEKINPLIETTEHRMEKMTLTYAIEHGYFSEQTGMFTDTNSGQTYTLQEAINSGFIDGDSQIYDVEKKRFLTVSEGLKHGQIDKKSGKLKYKEIEQYSLKDAAKMGLIAFIGGPILAASKIQKAMTGTGKRSKSKSPETSPSKKDGVFGTFPRTSSQHVTQESQHVEQHDAKQTAFYPDYTNSLPLIRKEESMNLLSTVVDYISPDNLEITQYIHHQDGSTSKNSSRMKVDSVRDLGTGNNIPLHLAVDRGIIDTHEGIFRNTLTGRTFSISDAHQRGYIDGKILSNWATKTERQQKSVKTDVLFSGRKELTVVSVLDTLSGERIGFQEALDRGIVDQDGKTYINQRAGEMMPITEAVSKDFVMVRDVNVRSATARHTDSVRQNTISQSFSVKVDSVVDPTTGKDVNLPSAIKSGVFDPRAGVVRNTITGEEISISEAFQRGMLKGESTSSADVQHLDGTKEGSVHMKSVFDPRSKQFIPVKLALEKGLIDVQSGTYRKEDGRRVSIQQGVKDGEIKTARDRVHSLGRVRHHDIIVEKPKKSGGFLPSDSFDFRKFRGDNEIIVGLKRCKVSSVLDNKRNQNITLEEAVRRGIVDHELCKYLDQKTRQTFDVSEAVDRGFIVLEGGSHSQVPLVTSTFQDEISLKAIRDPVTKTDIPLEEAIRKGIFKPEKGQVLNIRTGQMMSVEEAVSQGIALTDSSSRSSEDAVAVKGELIESVRDPMSGRSISCSEAIRKGIIDIQRGLYYDPKTGVSMSLTDAMKSDLVKSSGEKFGTSEKTTKDQKQMSIGLVLDTLTGLEIPVHEAIQRGILNPEMTVYTNLKTGESMPIEEGFKKGLVSGNLQRTTTTKLESKSTKPDAKYNITGVVDTMTHRFLNVSDALQLGILDNQGNFLDRKTGEISSVPAAMRRGLVVGEEITATKKSVRFKDALQMGYIHTPTGIFTDPSTNKMYTVDEAICMGLLSDDKGENFKYLPPKPDGSTLTFQTAIQTGKINPKNGMLGDRASRELSVEEALARQVLSPLSIQNKQSPKKEEVKKKARFADRHSDDNFQGSTTSAPRERTIPVQTSSVIIVKGTEVQPMSVDDFIPSENVMPDGTFTDEKNEKANRQQVGITSPAPLYLEDAIKQGFVDKVTGIFHDKSAGDMPVDEAVICGFLELHNAEPLDDYCVPNPDSPISISEAICSGSLNMKTAEFTNLKTNLVLPLQTALQLGYIQAKLNISECYEKSDSERDSSAVFVISTEGSPFKPEASIVCDKAGKAISRTHTDLITTSGSTTFSVSSGYMVDSSGHVVDLTSGSTMTMEQAASAGLVEVDSVDGFSDIKVVGAIPPSSSSVDGDISSSFSSSTLPCLEDEVSDIHGYSLNGEICSGHHIHLCRQVVHA